MNAIAQPAPLPAAIDSQDLEEQQYLSFMLCGEAYAISTLSMMRIIQYPQITEVPQTPDFVRGVINLRGVVIPVIDLSVCFGNKPASIGIHSCIIIVEAALGAEMHNVGVMADAVNALLEIPASEIEAAPVFGNNTRAGFIAGRSRINGKFVSILDIQDVLPVDEMAALVSMGASSAAPATDLVLAG
ncbi:MAG: chemotaxis protein CheW [Methylobacter sp.]